ncbi:MAG: hypothetical protein QOJ03_2524 [Frankiaceae bacterium]|nr:hypothetical protein [Frankiaceae bacterium]
MWPYGCCLSVLLRMITGPISLAGAALEGGLMTQPAWLVKALDQVGTKEGPNNVTKFGKHYGLNHNPWCAMFVSWACATTDHPIPSMQPGMPDGYASVWYGMQFAKANGLWQHSWNAKPGDAIVYGWDGPGSSPENMHTGFIVSSGPRGSIGHTCEGNRGDQVELQTFTVGQREVLGTIALTKLLARDTITVTPKPDPQPRQLEHPEHTGPTALSERVKAEAEHLIRRLEQREHAIAAEDNERNMLRRLQAAITTALDRTESVVPPQRADDPTATPHHTDA